MQASNRCCQCAHTWSDRPMGFARHPACPACGSAYWVWLDYPEEPADPPSPVNDTGEGPDDAGPH